LPTNFIFQGNPDRFDIDGYLAQAKGRISWLMTSSYKEITAGDQVFISRARGSKRLYESYGIIAECVAEGSASIRSDDPNAMKFWTENEGTTESYRVWLKLIRIAERGLPLDHKQIADNPVLASTGPLGYSAGTNYKLKPHESEELNELWSKLIKAAYIEKIQQQFDSQVSIFEKLSLDRLTEEYRRGLSKAADRPARTQVSTFVSRRSALVKASFAARRRWKGHDR
jgi:hypothetical protein